ncbi:hypothetical protein [Brevibacillus sp. NRS-1366]|uniref:hypothetical protein n=1 Tax=Brevibacillus sp. NRS-1366 TaxID=3233899 RepID=UPI003D25898E
MLDFGHVGFISFFPVLIMLAFYALVIYLIFTVIRFMKNKTLHDKEQNEKLDQLISLLKERERQE